MYRQNITVATSSYVWHHERLGNGVAGHALCRSTRGRKEQMQCSHHVMLLKSFTAC